MAVGDGADYTYSNVGLFFTPSGNAQEYTYANAGLFFTPSGNAQEYSYGNVGIGWPSPVSGPLPI